MDPNSRAGIAHLYRRAGFGLRADELDQLTLLGYRANVERLVQFTGGDQSADAVPEPAPTRNFDAGDLNRLIAWWLQRMVVADKPLMEKLTWFWHGHFATSFLKVGRLAAMLQQNKTLRASGPGDFTSLALAVAGDPAMMIWLDSESNVKGEPNENFARELMELFTLGTGPYTEIDVAEGARCFTGWRIDGAGYRVDPNLHDNGVKRFLGHTGNLGGEDVVTIVTQHPASALFIVAKLWSFFAAPVGPTDPVVRDLAPGFASDRNVTNLVRNLLLHPAFTSDAVANGLVRSPVGWLATVHRTLQVPIDDDAVGLLSRLGQQPFAPPNVSGWPAGPAWLTTASALERLRYAMDIARRADLSAIASTAPADRPAALARLLSVDAWGPASAAGLVAAAADPQKATALALVSPEFLVA